MAVVGQILIKQIERIIMQINTQNQTSFGMALKSPNTRQMSAAAINGLAAAKDELSILAKTEGVDFKPTVTKFIHPRKNITELRYTIQTTKEGSILSKLAAKLGLKAPGPYGLAHGVDINYNIDADTFKKEWTSLAKMSLDDYKKWTKEISDKKKETAAKKLALENFNK